MIEEIIISTEEKERIKCSLYNEFYKANRDNHELVDKYGKQNVEYWRQCRIYVEEGMRNWIKELNGKKKSTPAQTSK